ncbi:MAG: DDE-type integrase/transposase/recombinase [Alphaproteobacteria bacterium]|nr:DDE-type integrase/transposase/recombinase [Alphaproteobacteria bacterium]MCB9795852.1 DDE-type integrase/transposase/recombinase [Alphaproteobacteria bacterium]
MPPTPSPMALLRYQAISAYIATDPPRGQRRATLERLAKRPWTLPEGGQIFFAAETLRTWVRRYRQGGLDALEDKPRPTPGVKVLTEAQIERLCALKREVPERSLDRILEIAEGLGLVEPGLVRRSTLHRVLQAHDLSGRPRTPSSTQDLDRFEALRPNDLWQSDMLCGPWLPDPKHPSQRRRAWLYAFLDDHSRVLLAGRWSFKGDLPALELVFREALRRNGVPRRVYYDNGAVYRSEHMKQIVAHLGIHAPVHTTPYRPEGHGKIEAFNRLVRSAFIAELKASPVETLEQLNTAFTAWAQRYYNRRVHGETNEAPRDRWRAGLDAIEHVDADVLHRAFQWTEERRADKTGIFSLFGCRYQVGADLARRKVEVVYNPDHLDEVEVWYEGRFRERVRPFTVQPHRRPQAPTVGAGDEATSPTADWLGHLVDAHADATRLPDDEVQRELERERQDAGFVEVLRERLDPAVFTEGYVREWLQRFGPVDPEAVADALDFALPELGCDKHLDEYLDLIHAALLGGDA